MHGIQLNIGLSFLEQALRFRASEHYVLDQTYCTPVKLLASVYTNSRIVVYKNNKIQSRWTSGLVFNSSMLAV